MNVNSRYGLRLFIDPSSNSFPIPMLKAHTPINIELAISKITFPQGIPAARVGQNSVQDIFSISFNSMSLYRTHVNHLSLVAKEFYSKTKLKPSTTNCRCQLLPASCHPFLLRLFVEWKFSFSFYVCVFAYCDPTR